MGLKSHKRLRFMNRASLFYGISVFFVSALVLLSTISVSAEPTTPCLDTITRCQMVGKADINTQEFEIVLKKMKGKEEVKISRPKTDASLSLAGTRRFLSGPGSWPPRCASKCGRCTPCKPVHVPVPPGTPVTAEYYPEAWRCKCGNRLYMP